LWIDGLLRKAVGAAAVAALVGLLLTSAGASLAGVLALALLLGGWMALANLSAKTAHALPQLTALLDVQPRAGEAALAQLMSRRALMRGLRLVLYHRLAMLRHRQQDFAQSSAICQSLLMTRQPGSAQSQRPHLLLMLAEARLELGDALGAYYALYELHHTPLPLHEALQRMALRTRYELVTGHAHSALQHAHQKLALAALMPAAQCGAFHSLLATAAQRSGRSDWQQWLEQRVELICSPEQVAQLDITT